MGRRFLQDPLGRSFALKLLPTNACVLEMQADDLRAWNFHRRF